MQVLIGSTIWDLDTPDVYAALHCLAKINWFNPIADGEYLQIIANDRSIYY